MLCYFVFSFGQHLACGSARATGDGWKSSTWVYGGQCAPAGPGMTPQLTSPASRLGKQVVSSKCCRDIQTHTKRLKRKLFIKCRFVA